MKPSTVAAFAALLALVPAALAQPHPLLSGGPMPAYSEMTETAIWVQTTRPAAVQIQFHPVERLVYAEKEPQRWMPVTRAGVAASPEVRTRVEDDLIAVVKLTDLQPGTRYAYTLTIDGQEVRRDYPLRFQTQPHWRWAVRPAQPPEFTFAFGSCSYINQPETDRPGTPYGGGYEIYGSIAGLRPDFMLWLGDNVYYREMDWLTESAMRRRWRYDRAFPPLQALLGGTHHYATWDDHDFGPNDSDRSFRLRGAAKRVFSDYFPQVRRGTPETPGVFNRFEWGDVEFFMLDNRYHRAPNMYPDSPEKVMHGRAQMQWLKDSLVSSNATFKFVVGGGQMINPLTPFEGFGKYPREQKELFDFIAENKVRGVVFLSGDRHHSELLKVQWPGAPYAWLEFTSSPLTAGAAANPMDRVNPSRVEGTLVTHRSFGSVQVKGPVRERVLVLTAHDSTGKPLWSHEIAEADLR
jgi:alkaline phosphatase D